MNESISRLPACAPPVELLEKVTAQLRSQVNSQPNNQVLRQRLADSLRKQGCIQEALVEYKKLLCHQGMSNDVQRVIEALSGQLNTTAYSQRFNPAPIVIIDHFLDDQNVQGAFELMKSNQNNLLQASVDTRQSEYDGYNSSRRSTQELRGYNALKDRFREKVIGLLNNSLEPFWASVTQVSSIEVKFRAYRNHDFFEIHHDGGTKQNRLISFTWFFHSEPIRFRGGELVLFDTDTDKNTFHTKAYTRVIPKRNSIIFFPSNYYHHQRFEDARFVVNGHICG